MAQCMLLHNSTFIGIIWSQAYAVALFPSPYYRLQYNYKFSPGISPLFVLQAMIVVVEEATCAAYVYTTPPVWEQIILWTLLLMTDILYISGYKLVCTKLLTQCYSAWTLGCLADHSSQQQRFWSISSLFDASPPPLHSPPPNFFLPLPQLVGCTSLGSRTLSWWSAQMRPLQEVWWQGMYVYRKRLVGLPVSAPRSWQVSLFRLWVLFQSFSSLPHSFHFSSPLSSSFPLLFLSLSSPDVCVPLLPWPLHLTIRCFTKELFIHYGSNHQRRVRIEEFPLQLQNDFLHGLGHTNLYRIQLEGIKNDLAPLFKFVAGEPSCLIVAVCVYLWIYYGSGIARKVSKGFPETPFSKRYKLHESTRICGSAVVGHTH